MDLDIGIVIEYGPLIFKGFRQILRLAKRRDHHRRTSRDILHGAQVLVAD